MGTQSIKDGKVYIDGMLIYEFEDGKILNLHQTSDECYVNGKLIWKRRGPSYVNYLVVFFLLFCIFAKIKLGC